MDKKQAAQYLGVSDRTIENYARDGKLSVVYLSGKADYKESELQALKIEKETPVHRAIVSQTDAVDNNEITVNSALTEALEEIAKESEVAISEAFGAIIIRATETFIASQNLWRKLIWNLDEAAIATGFSRSHLLAAIKDGKLLGMKIGRGWKVRPADVENYTGFLFDQLSYK